MSELKRDIGPHLVAYEAYHSLGIGLRDTDTEEIIILDDQAFWNLVAFWACVKTERASRQAWEPLPALKQTEVKLAPAPISEDLKNSFETNPD